MSTDNSAFSPSTASAEGMKEIKPQNTTLCFVNGDIEYAERDGKKLHLAMIRPYSPGETIMKKLPLIVYVQGSAWQRQNIYLPVPQLSRFALRGFVIASVAFRESDISPFPAQMRDCKTAIRFLRANAEAYGIDVDNITLWGDSSGGHTALMAGITGDSDPDTDDYNGYSCQVNAIVNYYGPSDLVTMGNYQSIMDCASADGPIGLLLGKIPVAEHLELAKEASPVTYVSVDKPCPPVLTLHGDSDQIVPFEQGVSIYEALMKAGKHTEFYKLLGADHGTGEFWVDEIFDIVEEFIRRFSVQSNSIS